MLAALHLYLYHDSVLDGFGLSSFLTWSVLIGAGYGCLRLVRDIGEAILAAYRQPPGGPPDTPSRRL